MTRAEEAKHIKNNLLSYFLYRRNFLCATYEMAIYAGIADVIAISETGKIYEVEVKVDWADFKSELDAIAQISEKETLFDRQHRYTQKPKYAKHFLYLRGSDEYIRSQDKTSILYALMQEEDAILAQIAATIVPHKFFFSVPYTLKDKVCDSLKGTPYGVMDMSGSIYKKAEDLHKKEVPFELYKLFLRRLSRIHCEKMMQTGEEVRTL